jgi:lipoprotein-anchoring transpeptidase ErfK/SrfK
VDPTPPAPPTPPTPQPVGDTRTHTRRGSALLTIAKIVLGSSLLLLIMVLTILRNDAPAINPAGGAAMVVTTTAADTSATDSTGAALTPYQQAVADGGYLAVSAAVDQLQIYDHAPPGSSLLLTFPQAGVKQISSTFLAIGEAEGTSGASWYHIRLPIRPNGSTGWVRASDVSTVPLSHDIRVDISEHRLDLYERGQKVSSYTVAVGKGETPTALGDFYITLKARPVNTRNIYGDLIMMISAFSEQLPNWPNGGQAAIHGTYDTSTIGTDVSHGCIRMSNNDILELSESAALGTPVFVRE